MSECVHISTLKAIHDKEIVLAYKGTEKKKDFKTYL